VPKSKAGTEPRVEAVDARVFTVPTSSPEADGTLAWDSTTLVLVRVRCGDEVGTGWTYGPGACALVVREQLCDKVIGTDPQDVRGTSAAMLRAVRNDARPGLASYAIAAVDIALWDLKARLLGLPLHHLLGAVREEVPIYGSGGFTTYDEAQLAAQVESWLEVGAREVKIKIGESRGTRVDRDLERMRQVRRLVGDDVGLMVDANGGYQVKQAVRLLRDAADLDVRWFEEPVSSDDLEGLREVRGLVDADVTAGEYGCDLYYFRRMCAAGAVDCLQVDVSRCGGITEWLRAAAVAASYGLQVSGHCAPALHAHVAAAVPNLRHLEWFHDHVRIESMLFDGAPVARDGALHLDGSAPGHGLTLREGDAEQFAVDV
jgi:L-alanine-DL-glutamate epimerase-like enolase superfamily enzyme